MKLEELMEGKNNIKFFARDLEEIQRRIENKDELSDSLVDKLKEFIINFDPQWMPHDMQTGDEESTEWIYDNMSDILNTVVKHAALVGPRK